MYTVVLRNAAFFSSSVVSNAIPMLEEVGIKAQATAINKIERERKLTFSLFACFSRKKDFVAIVVVLP